MCRGCVVLWWERKLPHPKEWCDFDIPFEIQAEILIATVTVLIGGTFKKTLGHEGCAFIDESVSQLWDSISCFDGKLELQPFLLSVFCMSSLAFLP